MLSTTIFLLIGLCCCLNCHARDCGSTITAYTVSDTFTTEAVGNPNRPVKCKLHFITIHENQEIRLVVVSKNMPARDAYGQCAYGMVIYDGISLHHPELRRVCGSEEQIVYSSGREILLVFEAGPSIYQNKQGFTIQYQAFVGVGKSPQDESESDSGSDLDSGGLSSWEIVAFAIIPTVLFIGCTVFIYKRCKYYNKLRRNLAATGHTPEDFRMATSVLVQQASRGNLTQINPHLANGQAARSATPREVRLAAASMLSQINVGPIPTNPNDPLQDCLLKHMNHLAAQRLNTTNAANIRGGRVRHPAGDVLAHHQFSPSSESYPLYSPQLDHTNSSSNRNTAVPFISEDDAGEGYNHDSYLNNSNNHRSREHHYSNNDVSNGNYSNNVNDINNSNNNVMINNNTAANLNYQGPNGNNYYHHSTIPSHQQHQQHVDNPSTIDMTGGVYYAGDIDEHGNLHEPHTTQTLSHGLQNRSGDVGGLSLSPAGSASYLNHHHNLLDTNEDRISIGSGSGYNRSGRNSPRGHSSHGNRSNTNSLGRRSPRQHHHHHHHHHQEGGGGGTGNVLRYYGVIDGGQNSALSPTPTTQSTDGSNNGSNRNNANNSYMDAPPSYEEVTAGGRLSPYNNPLNQ